MQFPVDFCFSTWELVYTEFVFFFVRSYWSGLCFLLFCSFIPAIALLVFFFFSGPLYMEYDRREDGIWNIE